MVASCLPLPAYEFGGVPLEYECWLVVLAVQGPICFGQPVP